mmetsp:Transcript_52839/g.113191  ORF Transcript_52839/g.113191 Transcript_52839/m.113191 type:complete len:377 (+) Transcript_52839:178-1308(+)
MWVRGSAAFWALVLWTGASCAASRLAGGGGYLIASFPSRHEVNYARLPEPLTWRPLVHSGLFEPKALCIDVENSRLFVADPTSERVYWYQLEVLADGRLLTDGRQRIAAHSVIARGLAVDGIGSLYIAGRSVGVPPNLPPMEAVFKQDAIAIATGAFATGSGDTAALPPPPQLWTRMNTGASLALGATSSASSPELFEPSGLALGAFDLFWGNAARGPGTGAVVKASMAPPANRPEDALEALADNVEGVISLVLTPNDVFYGASGGIYGVSQRKAGLGCGAESALCPLVAATPHPTGMVWDGDGTIYVADHGSGGVLSFPSGSKSLHSMRRVGEAGGIFSLALYSGGSGIPSRAHAPLVPLVATLLVFAAALAGAV